ncbi:amidohydrolase family protein [Acuticoccus sp. MNP-M23]|uniref:amidohydrolase family protein n=1 Tax=Acuticoccus sp. MNP-M23 TaxID=3072793 RepID=UPI002815CB5F|nr:amidohydrolase family protein [Acuticoccus sp. MNP-M23]WMS44447.1 amidohydrolase family protein [Acuticoccus sp. MNP-M23]
MQIDPPTWHPSPRVPDYRPPEGAVDAHCHVFGPGNEFPYAPERKYTPSDAGKAKLFALRRHLGFSRNVLVQASCHGRDNAAMLDVLVADPAGCRGVAVVDPAISDAALANMNEKGVRGVRFNFVKRLVDPDPVDVSARLAARVAELGWHVVVYFEAPDFDELAPFLKTLPCDVVIDHMGRPDIAGGIEAPGFQAFCGLMENEKFWVKVGCPERLTKAGPPYYDVAPFARTLVEQFSDRVLWGTDWPHPNMKSHQPDDGLLVDRIPVIAPTEALRQKLLVTNPTRLYFT